MIAPLFVASGLLLLNGALAMDPAMDPAAMDPAAMDPAAMPMGGDTSVAATDMTSPDGSTAPGATTMQGQDGNMISVQVVKVSNKNADLKFDPEEVKAEPGTLLQFQFYPKMHTLTQSTFDKPCMPISMSMPNMTGIDSGPLPPENGMMKVFTMMVNDTQPLWFYCATGDHCQKGMSMVVNAPASQEKTLAVYKTASAQAATSNSTGSDSASNSTGDSSTAPGGDSAAAGEAASVASSMLKPVIGTTTVAAMVVAAFAFLL